MVSVLTVGLDSYSQTRVQVNIQDGLKSQVIFAI